MRFQISMVALAVIATAWFGQPAQAQFQLEPAFPNLSFASPVDLQPPGDGSDRLFVVERAGVIRVFDNDPAVPSAPVFLDIQSRVSSGGERGLLGLAFHPDYAENGFFYVNYTAPAPLRTVVARFEVDPSNPDQGDPDSEVILLEVTQFSNNHNGGQIAFGPDGFLYVALGDGGGSGDPQENGQNPETLLGALLRIDVNGATKQGGRAAPPDCGAGPNANYTIPADNPLLDGPGNTCDEIWAYGLRNPWRFSFDAPEATLWAADVGQGAYEEIDVIAPGGNYGWNTMEGFHCFDPPTGCDQTGLDLPVWEYAHNGQSKSVTGGYVYRGPGAPGLTGQYVYADYIDGRIWALDYDGQTAVNTLLLDTSLNISTFGVDEDGELYVVDIGGVLYRFISTTAFTIELRKLIRTANGTKKAKINWNTADVSTNKLDFYVDEAPDGTYLKRTRNDGVHKLKLKTPLFPGDGPFEIQACEKNSTTVCSNVVTADFTGVPVDGNESEGEPGDEAASDKRAADRSGALEALANYPNPFNPTTTIRFVLPQAGAVRLEVFDVLGRRVAVLAEGRYPAGPHAVVFDAGALPGGVYVYRMQAGSSVHVGRATLFR